MPFQDPKKERAIILCLLFVSLLLGRGKITIENILSAVQLVSQIHPPQHIPFRVSTLLYWIHKCFHTSSGVSGREPAAGLAACGQRGGARDIPAQGQWGSAFLEVEYGCVVSECV